MPDLSRADDRPMVAAHNEGYAMPASCHTSFAKTCLGLATVMTLASCSDVGPIGTLSATRLAWEAIAVGADWQARIDNPELTLTLKDRTETVAITYDDTWTGRKFRGTLSQGPLLLELMPGPCENAGKSYEFRARLTIGTEERLGCGSRGWRAP